MTEVLEATLSAGPRPEGDWPELTEALRGLLGKLQMKRATADLALLPPLSRAKCVDVPAVAPSQLDPLLGRNLRRYFAVPYAVPLGRASATQVRSGKVRRALAACADAQVIDTICQCAAEAGIRTTSITAGPVALAEGVRQALSRRRGRVVATWEARGWAGAVELVDGVPRRLEDWSTLPDTVRAERMTSVRAGRHDDEHPVHSLVLRVGPGDAGGAGDHGDASARPGDGASETPVSDPWIVTALGAASRGHQPPSLLPAAVTADLRRDARRRTRALWATAAVIVLVALGVHGYGLRQELAAIESARDRIAPHVARALTVRRSAHTVNDRLETISRIEREAPRWTPALAALTEVLPRSTYLVSLTTDGLSMHLGGVTKSSDAIVPELEESPLFADVALANVRAAGGGTEFDLSMALRPTVAPPAVANRGSE
jgi:hypothetical protein